MTDWRPSSGPDVAKRRAAIIGRLRTYFDKTSVLEVDTPALSPTAASDVQIESLEVKSTVAGRPLYLHTSPEFCMKRLLAAGYPDIYAMSRVFRDGEVGRNHQPEFTMFEWYRLGFGLADIITDTVAEIATALDDPHLVDDVTIINYADLFSEHFAIDPLNARCEELAALAQVDDEITATLADDRNSWLDLLMATKVAPRFPDNRLTVVQHYPAEQAALARLCPDDENFADRFEVFMGTLEIANGYVELQDPDVQAARIRNDQTIRERCDLPQRPPDQLLLDALRFGLPQCAGVAMGLERLHMLHDRAEHIRDVIPFAFET